MTEATTTGPVPGNDAKAIVGRQNAILSTLEEMIDATGLEAKEIASIFGYLGENNPDTTPSETARKKTCKDIAYMFNDTGLDSPSTVAIEKYSKWVEYLLRKSDEMPENFRYKSMFNTASTELRILKEGL